MTKTLAAVLFFWAAPAGAQTCFNCILNSAVPQNAQMNIGTATVRGTLTAHILDLDVFNVAAITADVFTGSGTYLTNLNASQLLQGTVPGARLAGAYSGITGVGTIGAGAWHGDVLGTLYGGTGQNFGSVSAGSLLYFSSAGQMSTILPGTVPQQLLQTGTSGSPAPVWTSSPAVSGANLYNIPAARLVGNLPPAIVVSSNSIPYVAGASVLGDIGGRAANITGTLLQAQIATGTWSSAYPASSITVTGATAGTCGGPSVSCAPIIRTDGRIQSWQQYNIAVSSSGLPLGPLPLGITVAPSQLTAGALPGNVIGSSLAANGVPVGTFGGPSTLAQITTTADGRIANIAQFTIPSISIYTAFTDVDNNWTKTQTFRSSTTVLGGGGVGVTYGVAAATATFTGTGAAVYSLRTSSGVSVSAGGVSAPWFKGDGSALTGIQTTPLPGDVAFTDHDNNFSHAQTSQSSWTVNNVLKANNFVGDGSGITNVTATLPSDVALTDHDNNWSHAQTSRSSWTFTSDVGVGGAFLVTDKIRFVDAQDTMYFGNLSAASADVSDNANTSFGFQTLSSLNQASANTAVGSSALFGYIGGGLGEGENTAVGANAGYTGNLITNATLFGSSAGRNLETGEGAVFLGAHAGENQTAGDNNIALGYNVNLTSLTGSNQMNLGNVIFANLATGDVITTSSMTASAFFGDGSHLSNVAASAVPASGVTAGTLPTTVLLNAGSLTNGRIASAILPSTVAYSSVENNWSHAQTSQSSWTINAASYVNTIQVGAGSGDGSKNAIFHGDVRMFNGLQVANQIDATGGGITMGATDPAALGVASAASLDASGGLVKANTLQVSGTGNAVYSIKSSSGVSVSAGGVTAPWFKGDGSAMTNLPAGPPPAGIVFDDPNQAEYVGTGINPAGTNNSIFGFDAANVSTGNFNTVYGNRTMFSQVSGEGNVAVGVEALYADIQNSSNTVVGFHAFHDSFEDHSGENTVVGALAMEHSPDSPYTAFDTVVGYSAGRFGRGYEGTSIGAYAGSSNTGNEDVYVGAHAGEDSTGSNNTFIGAMAGQHDSSNSGSIIIGVSGSVGNQDNKLYIGNTIFGDLAAQKVSIGAATFSTALSVYTGVVTSSTTAPSVSCSAGTGTLSPESTNQAGVITFGTLATKCTVTFSGSGFPKTPSCFCNDATVGSVTQVVNAENMATSGFDCNAGLAISGDQVNYFCWGAP